MKMKNLFCAKNFKKKPTPKKQPVKDLPAGWFKVAYHGDLDIANHQSIWGRRPADMMNDRLREVLVEKVIDFRDLPTLEELKRELRKDAVKNEIEDLFKRKLQQEMTDDDYQIGIEMAFNFIAEPRRMDLGILPDMAKRGMVSGGEIIERFYSPDYV